VKAPFFNPLVILLALAFCLAPAAALAEERIEHCDTYYHALSYVNLVASVTVHGATIHPRGGSMHPHEWLGVITQDYYGTKKGERVECIGVDGVVMCHSLDRWETGSDGKPIMIVSGETWPMRVDFITKERYLGTVVCICVWDKK
jgi:hypothetical protein